MLQDGLRSEIDKLWNKLWSGGLSNPLDAIEQFSYLLFLKRLDEAEEMREKKARLNSESYTSSVPQEVRWNAWKHKSAADKLKHMREVVFPWLREHGEDAPDEELSSFARYMRNAEFKISRASLLHEATEMIDGLKISEQNQDVQGDLYEYMLNKLSASGRNGQFRTPRHIIRMMVELVDPKPFERIGDLAAGTGGFLANAFEHILEQRSDQPFSEADWQHLQTKAFRGYDNDSGMTMLRIGSMNLMLHGIEHPRFFYADTLSQDFGDTSEYDVLLMNPPFKGAVNKEEVHDDLPKNTTKSELLFVHLMLRALEMGGRAAVIVPDGVLFGSSKAHVETRKKLVDENRLEGVISMPSGVFKPYAGVSTAVLLFTKGAKTERIWFYDMQHDGFSLDDKRQPVPQNDIPDILACWQSRFDTDFARVRNERLEDLKAQAAPLKTERLKMQANINRLTFESVIAPEGEESEQARAALETDQQKLAELESQIAPLQAEIDQLNRQFWVTKEQVKANKYDLSASRYKQTEQDEAYHEKPEVTMQRLGRLEQMMTDEITALKLSIR